MWILIKVRGLNMWLVLLWVLFIRGCKSGKVILVFFRGKNIILFGIE